MDIAVYQPLENGTYEPYLMATNFYKSTLKIQRYHFIPKTVEQRLLPFEMHLRSEEFPAPTPSSTPLVCVAVAIFLIVWTKNCDAKVWRETPGTIFLSVFFCFG